MRTDSYTKNGIHYLSGVERITIKKWSQDIDGIRFCLDGVNYECYEDPDDGWRSYSVLEESEQDCKYKFPPQAVRTEWIDEDDKSTKWELSMFDAVSNELVLQVGTNYWDDWYPCAIFEFNPENMKINAGK